MWTIAAQQGLNGISLTQCKTGAEAATCVTMFDDELTF